MFCNFISATAKLQATAEGIKSDINDIHEIHSQLNEISMFWCDC